MTRFSLFRRGKARSRRKLVDRGPPPIQRRRAKSESSRGSSSFDPSEYTLEANDFLNAQKIGDDVDEEIMQEWFFRKSMDSSPSRTDSTSSSFSNYPARRVHDLDRGPSDYGSTLGGGKDIEELAALDTRVLALAPSDQIEGWDQTTDDERAEGEALVRPVVVKAIQLSRKKQNAVKEKEEEEESEDDAALNAVAPVMRDRTWGRPLSALDAIFGTNKPKKPLSNEVSPDDAKIVRVLSLADPQENKSRMSWMRMRKSPHLVYKLEPQVEGKVVVPKGRSGFDSSVASSTTATSDNYTTTTVSTGSSNESGYTGDYGSLPTRSGKFLDDDDDFSDDAMQMGGCIGGGCNPVTAPCRTVAGDLSYFVNELMDQEIVIKEDSLLNLFARSKSSPAELQEAEKRRKNGKKRRGSHGTRRGNTAGRRATGYSEFS